MNDKMERMEYFPVHVQVPETDQGEDEEIRNQERNCQKQIWLLCLLGVFLVGATIGGLVVFLSPTPTTPTTPTTEYLFIGDTEIYELPSFRRANCSVPPHPVPGLSGAVSGLSNGSLVICGGYDRAIGTDYSSCHTLSDRGWEESASLPAPASYAAASQTTVGLMVTGGRLSTTQTLSGAGWITRPQLPVKISSHCQLSTQSSVYVLGGVTTDNHRSADVYKLDMDAWKAGWTKLPAMKTARYFLACAVYQDQIVLLGGGTASGVTASVELFDIKTQAWREGPPLPARMYFGQAIVTDNTLFYIGRKGKVLKLTTSDNWDEVTTIGRDDIRSLFPAPVVALKC